MPSQYCIFFLIIIIIILSWNRLIFTAEPLLYLGYPFFILVDFKRCACRSAASSAFENYPAPIVICSPSYMSCPLPLQLADFSFAFHLKDLLTKYTYGLFRHDCATRRKCRHFLQNCGNTSTWSRASSCRRMRRLMLFKRHYCYNSLVARYYTLF